MGGWEEVRDAEDFRERGIEAWTGERVTRVQGVVKGGYKDSRLRLT